MKFEVADIMGCCLLCRGPVYGKAVVVNNFDIICMRCAEGIAKCYSPAAMEPVKSAEQIEQTKSTKSVATEVAVCENCGKTFDNKMGLLAHKRRCKGGESK